MQALILAAGRGKRLKVRFSKPLLYLPGGTLLEYQLSMLAGLPLSSIFVVYSAPEVESVLREWEGVYAIQQKEPFTLMGALLSAEKEIGEQFLVLHGDNYFSQGLGYFLREAEGHKYAFLAERRDEGVEEARRLATTGAYILSPEVFSTLRLLRSKDRLVCLTEALLSQGEELYEVQLRGWRRNINTWEGLLETQGELLDNWSFCFHPPGSQEGYREGGVEAEGPTWISPEAEVSRSHLGPYVTVGPGARVEGCTLEEVIVFPRSQAEGLRLKRGVILPPGL
ncbi:MAG: NTP transferase domain-containing protein [Anaerolineae bacterium]